RQSHSSSNPHIQTEPMLLVAVAANSLRRVGLDSSVLHPTPGAAARVLTVAAALLLTHPNSIPFPRCETASSPSCGPLQTNRFAKKRAPDRICSRVESDSKNNRA